VKSVGKMNFFSPLLTLATLAVAISVGNGEDCTIICTDDDGDSGVRICRPKGKSGKWHTQVNGNDIVME